MDSGDSLWRPKRTQADQEPLQGSPEADILAVESPSDTVTDCRAGPGRTKRLDERTTRGSGANGKRTAYLARTPLLRERTRMLNIEDLFKGRHFDREIIILCVRWYLRFKLSFRDLVEMMVERGISLAHTTIIDL